MHLYSGTTVDFIQEVTRNNIARRLASAFASHFRYEPPPSEVRSWEQSLSRLGLIVSSSDLTDHGIVLEYQLPLTSRRLDALITGHDQSHRPNAVIVELKQWEACKSSDADEMVHTWLGGSLRDTLHPSVQARQYCDYLADMHSAFHEGEQPIALSGCSYLHNYRVVPDDPILAPKFSAVLASTPLFDAASTTDLEDFLRGRLGAGNGLEVLHRIEESSFRPSKQLLMHVSAVVRGEPRFVLLDEQQVVFQRTLAEAKRGFAQSGKSVILAVGGPGTGKSVLAANLLGHLSRAGLNVQYTTGSKSFTETLRKILGGRASAQLTYTNSYMQAKSNSVDVLICDEAHRIRAVSTNRFARREVREKARPQIDELLSAAKVTVFFIDDLQAVRPDETGSADLIRKRAIAHGATLWEYSLPTQFRCAGSDSFINWVDNTLGTRRTANQIWNAHDEAFDFRVYRTVEELDRAIRMRASEGYVARLTAGYCWPWSEPNADGTLVDDIEIRNFKRPWNAPPDAKRLAPGIPKSIHWAYDPGGTSQVGCVYTAQGFEFDYVGVIWGEDLTFDLTSQLWRADRTRSFDRKVSQRTSPFESLVRNTYRVLLSRGIRGCYVYCEDEATAMFLLSRTEGLSFAQDDNASINPRVVPVRQRFPKLPVVPSHERRPFKNCIPVYDLEFAAGQFGEFQVPEVDEVEWVAPPEGVKPASNLFIARVEGESMNRVIPSGSWCVFRANPVGSRNGKVVVIQLRDSRDPESGAAFTVKRYRSEKSATSNDGVSATVRIVLRPESTDPTYQAIELLPDEENAHVVAEFLCLI